MTVSFNQSITQFTLPVCNGLCKPVKTKHVREHRKGTASVQHGMNFTVPGVLMTTKSPSPMQQSLHPHRPLLACMMIQCEGR